MIKSMTGYGRGNISKNDREYQIEIKSVNHRYLDISVKMPRQLSYLEDAIKKEISSKVKRGKIDVFITFNNNSLEGRTIKINTELAHAYITELKKLSEEEEILSDIQVTEISKYPDVLNIQNEQDDDKIKEEVIEVLNNATDNFICMRQVEGSKISEDLLKRLDYIQVKVNEISKFSTGLIEEYVVKLEGRIKEILKGQELDENRLAQEVVIYADKCRAADTWCDYVVETLEKFLKFLSQRNCLFLKASVCHRLSAAGLLLWICHVYAEVFQQFVCCYAYLWIYGIHIAGDK